MSNNFGRIDNQSASIKMDNKSFKVTDLTDPLSVSWKRHYDLQQRLRPSYRQPMYNSHVKAYKVKKTKINNNLEGIFFRVLKNQQMNRYNKVVDMGAELLYNVYRDNSKLRSYLLQN